MEIELDALTVTITRVLTAGLIAPVAGALCWAAVERSRLSPRLRSALIFGTALATGILSFVLAWASVKLSLLAGLSLGIVGVVLISYSDASIPRALRILSGIVLAAGGFGWCVWLIYAIFSR